MKDLFVAGIFFPEAVRLLEEPCSLDELRRFFEEVSGVFGQYKPLDKGPAGPSRLFDWNSFSPAQWEALRAAWRRKCVCTSLSPQEVGYIIRRAPG